MGAWSLSHGMTSEVLGVMFDGLFERPSISSRQFWNDWGGREGREFGDISIISKEEKDRLNLRER